MSIYPKNFFEETEIKLQIGKCFVLMPFDKNYDEIYHEVIKECLDENNFITSRADELFGSIPIMEDILEQIESSEIIIADLTGKNPNVLYELGLAHARKPNKNVIILTQNIDDVPFDLRPYRVIKYHPSISGAKDLKNKLSQTLLSIRLNPLTWCGQTWLPTTQNWISINNEVLRSELPSPNTLAMGFIKKPISCETMKVSFLVSTEGPEVNLMLFTDQKNRYSGYHIWFWSGGIKLRRIQDEKILIKEYTLSSEDLHEIEVIYNKGLISAQLDKKG